MESELPDFAHVLRAVLTERQSIFDRLRLVTALHQPGALKNFLIEHRIPYVEELQIDELRSQHHRIFCAWIGLTLQEQALDLELYAEGERLTLMDVKHVLANEPLLAELIPHSAMAPEASLFRSDLEVLRAIMAIK